MMKIDIPHLCEPYMYNTYDDLLRFKKGDKIEIKFQNKKNIPKKYRNKSVSFIVNNFLDCNWRRPTKRLALVPIEKRNDFKKGDILFLDDSDRFECLMIDLFPIDRIPYRMWKTKTVKIKL